MPIIKLLGFYLLFSLPFTVFAQQQDLNINPQIFNSQEIDELCGAFKHDRKYDECLVQIRYLNKIIVKLCSSYPNQKEFYDECLAKIRDIDASTQEITRKCDGAGAYMRDCLSIKVKHSQHVLENIEQKVISYLEWNWNWNLGVHLSNSNKAFILYRDMQCDFTATLFGGGTGRSMMIPACITAKNNERILQLRKLMSSLESHKKKKEENKKKENKK